MASSGHRYDHPDDHQSPPNILLADSTVDSVGIANPNFRISASEETLLEAISDLTWLGALGVP